MRGFPYRQPFAGNAIKLSGRTSWLPIGGAARRAEGAALRYIPHCSMAASMPLLPSALPPKGEASRYDANNFLNLIAFSAWGRLNVFSYRQFQISAALRSFDSVLLFQISHFKETLIKPLSDFILGFLYRARRHSTRIASYLRRMSTTLCIKIHMKSDSAIESAFP